MKQVRRALVAALTAGAALAVAPSALACTHNNHFTFSKANGWFAPTGAPKHFYGIASGDCNYISEKAAASDDFEAFVSSNATSWNGGGIKLVSTTSFTKLYTGLSGKKFYYVEDTGRDFVSNRVTIAQ